MDVVREAEPMRLMVGALMVLLLVTPGHAANEAVTIGMLAERCQPATVGSLKTDTLTETQQADAEWCRAYMRGVHDMNGYVKTMDEAAQGYCFPNVQVANLTYLVRVFVGWAGKNPDKAGLPAADGVVEALRRVFPC